MNFFYSALLICLISTSFLLFCYWCLYRFKIVKVDLVRFFGSAFTENDRLAYRYGLFIHTLGGVFFGCLYILMFYLIPLPSENHNFVYPALGFSMGFNHGMIDSLALSIFIPRFSSRYKELGLHIAIFHGLALIPYGLFIGVLFKHFIAN